MRPLAPVFDNLTRSALQRFVNKTPLLFPTVAFVIGLWTVDMAAAWVTVTLAAALAAAAVASGFMPRRHLPRLRLSLAAAAAAMAVGLIDRPPQWGATEAVTGKFTALVTDRSENNTFQTLSVKLLADSTGTGNTLQGVCGRVSVSGFERIFEPGCTIRFKGRLMPVATSGDVDGETDINSYLRRKGMAFTAIVNSPQAVETTGEAPAAPGPFRRLGLRCGELIDNSTLTPLAKSYLSAFLMGDRSQFDPSQQQLFSAAGVAHMLALSGTHTGVIAMLASLVLMPVSLFGWSRWKPLGVGCLVWVFALATGAQPSVVRAATMLSVFIVGRVIMRPYSSANSLCLSALILLAAAPSNLFDLGFQLSFASVASILAFGNCFNPVSRRHRLLHPIFAGWSVSVAATLGTAVIAAFHFHFFPVYFLVGNTVVGLIVPLVIGFGAVMIACEAAELAYGAVAALIDLLCGLAYTTVETIASLPGATVDNIFFPALTAVPYLLALIALRIFFVSRRKIHLACSGVAAAGVAAVIAANSTVLEANEWFVNRSANTPQVIVAHGGMLTVHAGSRPPDENRLKWLGERYRPYMCRRRLGGPVAATPPKSSDEWTQPGKLITLPDQTTIFIVDNRTKPADMPFHCNYLILGTTRRLDLISAEAITSADTIVVNSAADSAALAGRPVIDLRHTSLRRRLRSN